jgi:hypothetical protein
MITITWDVMTLKFLAVLFLFCHVAAALDLSIDHTNLEYLVTDNMCNNLASFFTHHLHHQHHQHQHHQPQEQYLALEKLYQVQSVGLGGM